MEWLQLASHEALAGASQFIHRVRRSLFLGLWTAALPQFLSCKGMSQSAVRLSDLPVAVQVLQLSASDSSLTRDALIQHAGVFARPEVLKEGFHAAVSKPSKDAAHAVTSQELALLQVMHQ